MSQVEDRLTTRRLNLARIGTTMRLWTAEQIGAWFRLETEVFLVGEIPDEPTLLARLAVVTPQRWPTIWATIGRHFRAGEVPGTLVSESALSDRNDALALMSVRRDVGRRGGRPRKSNSDSAATDEPDSGGAGYTAAELAEMGRLLGDIMVERVRTSTRPRRQPTRHEVLAVATAAGGRPWEEVGRFLVEAAKSDRFAGAVGYGLIAHAVKEWRAQAGGSAVQ